MNISMLNIAGFMPQINLFQESESADASFAEMLLRIIKPPGIVTAAEPETPEITYRESDDAESLIKLLESIGVPIEAARQITAEYAPEKNYGGPDFTVDTIENYTPQEPGREWVSEDIKRIISEIMRPAETENIDFTQISRSPVFKTAIAEYVSEYISTHKDSIDPTVKERAELMTKAVKAIDGELKIEKLTAPKTGGTRQIIQNAAYTAPAKISIEDMVNVMKKAPVMGFTETIMREAPKTAPAAPPEPALNQTEPVITVSEKTEERIPKPDFWPELKAPETKLANEPEQILTAETNTAKSAEEIAQIIAGKTKAGAPAGEFEVKMKLSPKELGELTVKVSYSKGSVTIDITAANKTAETGILTRVAELRESLAVRGISLADVSVGVDVNDRRQKNNDAPREGYTKNSYGSKDKIGALNPAETERRETVINYMRSRRLLYKTI